MWKLLFVFVVTVSVVASYDDPCDDPNAAPPPDGCSWNCNQHCSNYINNQTGYCPRIVCPPDKCGCKKGYYYDRNYKNCVPGEDCSFPQPD